MGTKVREHSGYEGELTSLTLVNGIFVTRMWDLTHKSMGKGSIIHSTCFGTTSLLPLKA